MNNANKTLSDALTQRNEILDSLPGVVYIIEMIKIWETHPIKNVYANKFLFDLSGISREAMDKPGYDFLKMLIHPPDYDYFLSAMEQLSGPKRTEKSSIMVRVKTVYDEDQWLIGNYREFRCHKHYGYFQIIFNGIIVNESILPKEIWLLFLREKAIRENILKKICLTKYQKEVLQLISEGLTSEEICKKIFKCKDTVDYHRKKIREKLGASNSADIIRLSHEYGLI